MLPLPTSFTLHASRFYIRYLFEANLSLILLPFLASIISFYYFLLLYTPVFLFYRPFFYSPPFDYYLCYYSYYYRCFCYYKCWYRCWCYGYCCSCRCFLARVTTFLRIITVCIYIINLMADSLILLNGYLTAAPLVSLSVEVNWWLVPTFSITLHYITSGIQKQ